MLSYFGKHIEVAGGNSLIRIEANTELAARGRTVGSTFISLVYGMANTYYVNLVGGPDYG